MVSKMVEKIPRSHSPTETLILQQLSKKNLCEVARNQWGSCTPGKFNVNKTGKKSRFISSKSVPLPSLPPPAPRPTQLKK